MNFFRKANTEKLNMDAWSDGQVASKIWLCRHLEAFLGQKREQVRVFWFFGSWYGTLPHMLLTRERILINEVHCFDIDKTANRIAAKVLDHWKHANIKVEISNVDCNYIHAETFSKGPDVLINTSCEHMANYNWWKNLPTGTLFAFQSTNMEHPTHINKVRDLQEFKEKIFPAEFYIEEQLNFEYPNLAFKRFLLIGRKL